MMIERTDQSLSILSFGDPSDNLGFCTITTVSRHFPVHLEINNNLPIIPSEDIVFLGAVVAYRPTELGANKPFKTNTISP